MISRAVVVGCGAIGPIHLQAIEKSKNACVYGVFDNKAENRDKFSKEYNCKAFENFDDVLLDHMVDSVHICTPHFLHAPMLMAAVKAGKNVVIEKPVAINLADFKQAKQLVAESTVSVCSVLQNRYNPCIAYVKKAITEGVWGKVLGLKGFMAWNRPPVYYQKSDWRGKWATEGGGLVINQALHTLDLLCYLGGNPAYIKGSIDTRLLNEVIEVEDTAEATIYFDDGVLAHFFATNNFSTNAGYDIEINFEACSLRYIFGQLYLINKDGVKVIAQDGIAQDQMGADGNNFCGKSHEILINNYYSELAGQGGIYTDINDALVSMLLVDGIYTSAKTGKKVKLSFE